MNSWGGVTELSRRDALAEPAYTQPQPPLDGFPPHIDVYVTGIAKCRRCGERLCGWEDNELREWVDEHSRDEEPEDDDDE